MKKKKEVWVHKKRSDNRWESKKTDTRILDEIEDSLLESDSNSWTHPFWRKFGKEFLFFFVVGWIGIVLAALLVLVFQTGADIFF